jgi:hypothetical protein
MLGIPNGLEELDFRLESECLIYVVSLPSLLAAIGTCAVSRVYLTASPQGFQNMDMRRQDSLQHQNIFSAYVTEAQTRNLGGTFYLHVASLWWVHSRAQKKRIERGQQRARLRTSRPGHQVIPQNTAYKYSHWQNARDSIVCWRTGIITLTWGRRIGYVKLDRTSKRAERIGQVLRWMFSEEWFPRCS